MGTVSRPAVAFGPLLRAYRRAAGLTQEALAERAGLSRRGLQHLEAGDARPYPGTLGALAAALGLTPPDRERLRAAVQSVPARPRPAGSSHDPNDPRGRRPGRALAPSTLPASLTSFVGRERELAEVARLLGGEPGTLRVRPRLLTLTGPGGVGKTRLAIATAEVMDGFRDGARFVDLAPLTEDALVPATLARALGVREASGGGLLERLQEHLRSRHLLLVLDNAEHLLDACARVVDALLQACPHLCILVTSREPLGIAGETTWQVPSLALPDAPGPQPVEALVQFGAVQLFIDRALAVLPSFRFIDQNASAIAQVCRRLDGVPLAIELAAAKVRVLAPEQLVACQSVVEGERCLSLMRASLVVKRQLTACRRRLRARSHAAVARARVGWSGRRSSRHWRASTESSSSAMWWFPA